MRSVGRMRHRLGPAKAITAAAHKLVRIIYDFVTRWRVLFHPPRRRRPPITRRSGVGPPDLPAPDTAPCTPR